MRRRTKGRRRPPSTSKYLVFVDTNKFLDFYRTSSESSLVTLRHLVTISEHVITSHQIEMEFLKNRHAAITGSLANLVAPTIGAIPAFLHESPNTVIRDSLDKIKAEVQRLKALTVKMLQEPTSADEVYKLCHRIFNNRRSQNCLRPTRSNSTLIDELTVRASKRFQLGHPPRKNNDTSMGDAFNWEWVLHCAGRERSNVILVTSDHDYGKTVDGKTYLNDFLRVEFKKAIGSELILTNRLTDALKQMDVSVSKKEVQAETESMKGSAWPQYTAYSDLYKNINWPVISNVKYGEALERVLGSFPQLQLPYGEFILKKPDEPEENAPKT
jgi:hypothetical protein